MKLTYDQRTDTLVVLFKEASVAESDEAAPGIILDYDEHGGLVAIEVLDASKRLSVPMRVEIEFAPGAS
jgi:uncharacterized protein YuzE